MNCRKIHIYKLDSKKVDFQVFNFGNSVFLQKNIGND
jgi:hypothetical protein